MEGQGTLFENDRTTVVNINAGQDFDVYIGRAGKGHDGYFCNPYRMTPRRSFEASAKARTESLDRFRAYFLKRLDDDPEFRRRVLALRGKRLGCFCHPAACHGDVIAQWIESHDHQ